MHFNHAVYMRWEYKFESSEAENFYHH